MSKFTEIQLKSMQIINLRPHNCAQFKLEKYEIATTNYHLSVGMSFGIQSFLVITKKNEYYKQTFE